MERTQRATIADVAELAGVHQGTASRALNEHTRHKVKQDTVDRVVRAAKQLGYAPNALARGLRTRNSMTIGVVIPDITNPLFPPIVRGIEKHLEQRGYSTLLANTDGFESGERGALNSLLDRRVDGLIVASGQREESAIAELYESGVKVVLLNRDAGQIPYPLVIGDDATGIAESVKSLYDFGHRRVLHIAGPLNISTSALRAAAFETACRSFPDMAGHLAIAEALSIDAGRAAVAPFLDSTSAGITGIVAGNDLIALGVLRELRQRGIDCPREVSVVGFNDIQFAEDFCPPLSTVRVPAGAMGMRAAQVLLEALDSGEQVAQTITLPVTLILRGSTAAAPSDAGGRAGDAAI